MTTEVFDGQRPVSANDLTTTETAGIAAVPPGERLGGPRRLCGLWAAGNLEMSTLFLGTIPAALGLGWWPGLAALAIGLVAGTIPVAILGMWGPQTGAPQLALSRAAFGKLNAIPGALQTLSGIGWIAIGCLFGAQALQVLGLPFGVAAPITVLIVAGLVLRGYNQVMKTTQYVAILMTILFALIAVQLFRHHTHLPATSAHGTAFWGAFVLMVAVALSGSFSWVTYATDYSRYLPENASRRAIFGWTCLGMIGAYAGVSLIGLAAANTIGSGQTAAGVYHLMNGGPVGVIAMLGILVAAVTSSSLNGYSTTLAAQASEVKLPRLWLAGLISAIALAGVFWLDVGDTAERFTNLLLATAYWCAPWAAVVMLDWHYNHREYNYDHMRRLLDWDALPGGRGPMAALIAGLAAMIPFVDTTLWEGPGAKALGGGDIAFYAGPAAAALAYLTWRWLTSARTASQHIAAPLP